ncbi:DUF1120 domain-containing protein [Pandoraea sp.]|uniref:DUF1120 domain-containing protein n=1 Tax=Pandoraea sp. TaxID=1883445 RepID=UPI0012194EBE|nr:DUF1120 domain-containing protein [Pandoraea sp.]TAL54757.1 MAG: DUF1120 domain-containing protein [Pandoraea sp.]
MIHLFYILILSNLMKNTKKFAAASLLAVLCGSVMAQSIPLKVSGTIKPPACTPKLGDAAGVDYKTIEGKNLSMTEPKHLGAKSTDLTIECPTAAAVRLKISDTKATSSMGRTGLPSEAKGALFGLGQISGNGKTNAKVGGYTLTLVPDSFKGNANSVNTTVLRQDGSNWVKSGDGFVMKSGDVFAWAEGVGTNPSAFTKLVGKIQVDAYANRLSDLPLGADIPLDGLSTLELVYN